MLKCNIVLSVGQSEVSEVQVFVCEEAEFVAVAPERVEETPPKPPGPPSPLAPAPEEKVKYTLRVCVIHNYVCVQRGVRSNSVMRCSSTDHHTQQHSTESKKEQQSNSSAVM